MVERGTVGRKITHDRIFEDEQIYFMEKETSLAFVIVTVKSVQNYLKLSDEEIKQTLQTI